MNDSAKKKIRALLLSSAAALIHQNSNAEAINNFSFDIKDDNNSLDISSKRWNRVYKNVASLQKNGDIKYIASHRSHMSHRSGGGGGGYGHRSHSSHYSSYGGSSHYSSSSSSSYSGSSRVSTPKPHVKTPGEYSYGDRTLKNGIYGSDVSALTSYLSNALYINRASIQEKSGYSVYDANIANAIKHFQKDAGLRQTGIADSETLNSLKSWDAAKTTVILGTRELSFSESAPDRGTDVTELVNLLTKVGFAPDPKKIIVSDDGRTEFTKDIETAVRFFQAYNKLNVTGRADEATIKALKAKAK